MGRVGITHSGAALEPSSAKQRTILLYHPANVVFVLSCSLAGDRLNQIDEHSHPSRSICRRTAAYGVADWLIMALNKNNPEASIYQKSMLPLQLISSNQSLLIKCLVEILEHGDSSNFSLSQRTWNTRDDM